MQKVKVRGQRSRSQEVKTQFSCFQTVTLVWIHIWWRNDVQGLMWHRRFALLFFKVIHDISRSHRRKIANFDPVWAFLDCNTSLNSQMAMKWCIKLEVVKRCPIVFQGHLSNIKVKWDKNLRIFTRIKCFWTLTPVWIDHWLQNDVQNFK